jgi:hypothetical protein
MFKFFDAGRIQRLLPVERVHPIGGQLRSGCNIQEKVQPPRVVQYPSLPSGTGAHKLLSHAVQVLRESAVGESSKVTYHVGFKQFCTFLGVAKITTSGMSLTELLAIMCVFAAYLFFFRGLQPATIRSYVQGTDHHLRMLNIIPGSVYHPALNQTLRGIDRQTSFETALINRAKLPFSLPLILLARSKILFGATIFELHAIFASLCFGFMFLLRKSEYLPNKSGKGKRVNGINYTLLSDNV